MYDPKKLLKDYFALSLVADKDNAAMYHSNSFPVCRHFVVTGIESSYRKKAGLEVTAHQQLLF